MFVMMASYKHDDPKQTDINEDDHNLLSSKRKK